MSLSREQQKFASDLGLFLVWIYQHPGWSVTGGEWHRPQEMADIYAERGTGVKDSLHTMRLAIDLNFFIDGEYQTSTSAYEEIGSYWESLNINNRWGGKFLKPDGNHFQRNL